MMFKKSILHSQPGTGLEWVLWWRFSSRTVTHREQPVVTITDVR